MSPHLLPSTVSLLQIFLPFVIFFLSIVKISSGEFCKSSTSCKTSNINISYPFWKLDDHEEGRACSPPNFGINCSNSDPSFPLITINGHSYRVKDINYSEKTITLVDYQVLYPSVTCPWRLHQSLNFNESAPFSYNYSVDLNVAFSSGCGPASPGDIPSNLYSIGCGTYLIVGRIDSPSLDWIGDCKETMETAVMRTEEIESPEWRWNESIAEAMRKGFVLDWQYPSLQKGGMWSKSKIGIVVGVGLGGAFVAIAIGAWCCLNKRKKKKAYVSSYFMSRSTSWEPSSSSTAGDVEKAAADCNGVHLFDYCELEEATQNFHPKNELGDGGFGTVYKGKLRDGRVVAVKRLYENNFKRVEQFRNEIEILHRLAHKNLVRLYGYTSRRSRELLLVYEYVPNGTIADHLHGTPGGRLPWATRLNIAVETASALAYLHASEVIHRDVKTTNILLDEGFRVKVADFGLSRLFPTHATHVSTAPQGTPGYLDPEYHECYQLTSKSDVYSFGVVLVELISSLPAVDITRHRHEINLANMALAKIQCNALHELVDSELGFESDECVRGAVCAVAEVAFQCLQGGKEMRPTMKEVLESLEEIQSLGGGALVATEEKKVSSVGSPLADAPLLSSSHTTTSVDNIEISDHKKNVTLLSPNSVIAKWPSRSTTQSCSG